MSMIQSDLLLGQEGGGGYQIERSLRFNSADSAYLSRTFTSAGNRKTWTWAGWVKRSSLSSGTLFSCTTGTTDTTFALVYFNADRIDVTGYLSIFRRTNRLFRDTSAWYHIVIAFDTTQAAGADRIKVYVNGTQETFSSSTDPTLNTDYGINQATAHEIGRYGQSPSAALFDGYLADVHFIDGQALTPTSFGEFDTNNVWQPKKYSGPTPTGNSFWLPFSDNSATTATTLGKDGFLLGNNWTPVNLSVNNSSTVYSSGATYLGNGLLYSGSPAGMFGGGNGWGVMLGASSSASLTNGGKVTFPTPLTNVNSIIANVRTPNFYTATIFVNNNSSGINIPQNQADVDINITAALTGSSTPTTFSSITFGPTTWDGYLRINYLVVNGVRLTDSTFNFQNDSLVDSPSNYGTDTGAGGEVRGNYCTWNPLFKSSDVVTSNGNLDTSKSSSSSHQTVLSTFFASTGKWYAELRCNSGNADGVGIATSECNLSSGFYSSKKLMAYRPYGALTTSTYISGVFPSWSAGDVVRIRLDLDNQKFAIAVNGGNFSEITITNYDSHYAGELWSLCVHSGTEGGVGAFDYSLNAGQRPFAYAAPAGFKSLNTANLPTPTITNGATAMDAVLYTGTGSTLTPTSTLGFSPDLVWIKSRSAATDHTLYDTVRGTQARLESNTIDAEVTSDNGLTAFNSNGFTLGTLAQVNTNAATYAGWCWDAGSSTVTNTAGTISSQVRANASAGFSIVTYTGNGTSGATVGHGLGVAPGFIIIKDRTAARTADQWPTYHVSIGASGGLVYLNSTSSGIAASSVWNNTNPTSSVFTLGNWGGINYSGDAFVAYCFAPVAGYSAFGSYTGNGSTDGPFVYTGFRPRLLLLKIATGGPGSWGLIDSTRSTYNVTSNELYANLADAEYAISNFDFLSNGFKLRTSSSAYNGSGNTFLWAAFAENPFALARAR